MITNILRLLVHFFDGKNILITGGAGTIGSELARQLLTSGLKSLILIDSNETAVFFLRDSFKHDDRVKCLTCDIKEYDQLKRLTEGIDYLFHTAALKHVPSCEFNPFASVSTNVNGVINIINACQDSGVKKALFTSSDKAVNPANVMGATKLTGEKLFIGANNFSSVRGCKFISCRFGNVVGSSGSVIPLFIEQIKNSGVLNLTHPEMTRFVMSLREATALVIEAMTEANDGEIYISKMPTLKIKDLAINMIDNLSTFLGRDKESVKIQTTGLRDGEKLYEELARFDELQNSQ